MNEIRLAVNATGKAVLYRNNVGFDKVNRVRYGLGVGSSDLIGFRFSDGVFLAVEVKTPTGRDSEEQVMFRDFVNSHGAICIVARSADEALVLLSLREGGE